MKEEFSICSVREQMQVVFNEIQEVLYDKGILLRVPFLLG